jgi:hypothetical protein
VLLVREPEGGCGGTCVTASVMTEVGFAVGSAVGMVDMDTGVVVCVILGTCVGETVIGEVGGAEVVVFVATALTEVLVVGIADTPGRGVPGRDCQRELSPSRVAGPAIGVPVICAR